MAASSALAQVWQPLCRRAGMRMRARRAAANCSAIVIQHGDYWGADRCWKAVIVPGAFRQRSGAAMPRRSQACNPKLATLVATDASAARKGLCERRYLGNDLRAGKEEKWHYVSCGHREGNMAGKQANILVNIVISRAEQSSTAPDRVDRVEAPTAVKRKPSGPLTRWKVEPL